MTGVHGIILRCGKILLIKREVPGVFFGYWGIPGGGQEKGETLVETVMREVAEEIGLKVDVVKKLGELIGSVSGTPQHIFLCRYVSGDINPGVPEVTDVKWVAYEKISRLRIVPYLKEFLLSLKLEALEKELTQKDFVNIDS